MQGISSPPGEIDALEAAALQAAQSGRDGDAVRHWNRILEIDPRHVRALGALGQRAFRQGDMYAARAAFQQIVGIDGTIPQQWIQLAIACRNLKDDACEDAAIRNALKINPRELVGAAPSRQPGGAQGQDARGEACLRRRGGGSAAAAATASRSAPRSRRRIRLRRELQPREGTLPRRLS